MLKTMSELHEPGLGPEVESTVKKRDPHPDMVYLIEAEEKINNGEALNGDDLRIIWESITPEYIKADEGDVLFDHQAHYEFVKKLREGRDVVKDLSEAYGIDPEQIATKPEDAFKEGIVYYYGNLILKDSEFPNGLVFPHTMTGDLFITNITNAQNIKFPEIMNGFLDLRGLTTFEGLVLPTVITDTLYLKNLEGIKELVLPKGCDVRHARYSDT